MMVSPVVKFFFFFIEHGIARLSLCVIFLFFREERPTEIVSGVLVFCNKNVNIAVFQWS